MLARVLGGTAMAAILVGAGPANAQEQTRNATPVSSPPSGRYQIVISPFTEKSTYLLDTETGSVWQLQNMTSLNTDPLVWSLMPRISDEQDMARLVSQFGKKPGAKGPGPGAKSMGLEPRQ